MSQSLKNGVFGLQHVLAMYAGAVIVPLIVGGALGLNGEALTYLVSIDLLMCGVATILQALRSRYIGIGLPVVLGCTFTAVAPMMAIGQASGITAIYGAILVAGVFVIAIAPFFGKLASYFPPVVTGSVVTIIGITLIPVAMGYIQGESESGQAPLTHLFISFVVLATIIGLQRLFTGFIRAVSILIGLVGGSVLASFFGLVDFTAVKEASWFHMPEPFYFGAPTFLWGPIITMILVAMVSLVESTGVYYALADLSDRELDERDLTNGYRAEGVGILLGGFMNAFPYTAYSQNVGLVQLSGMRSPKVVITAGVMLVVIGFVPKVGALTTLIPDPVLGGAMIAMFGMVMAYGIKMLSATDLARQENLLIIACSVGIGLGVTVSPETFQLLPSSVQMLTENGIVAGSFTAIILNVALNHRLKEKSQKTKLKKSKQVAS
ncbi:xanthine permease [Pontibacillus halophilus JSM 076056 = DSM 19796]|uniref:Xanthine permease n=1 Tax=Pontibacillus halophilus JSM 076056 = DSM 19796 TaxID=1385510 RepID=A0A0A5GE97_9BACI|nr:nucleobase:cation symporter-2 family protein [Pontibacillus halophilus]KGX89523.1 xanthine permease [Pontibacillus halophilus JSM 076056 = DSM 19796]